MKIKKAAELEEGREVDQEDLGLINKLSRKTLKPEEVYAFAVRLCDNEIDRDGERFSSKALKELAEKFLGKSGVFDHQWSARGQAARIYRTQVIPEAGVLTRAGDEYRYLKAWAYMLRTEGNRDLIAEIEGGIKKEVSVGCAVERAVCSVCGQDRNGPEGCFHRKGQSYGGKLCWSELTGVTDAYEWSFVAVPAQPRAGVMKRYSGEEPVLRKALEGHRDCLPELERLEREAALGRNYLENLRAEVVRLGGLAEKGASIETLAGIAQKLEEPELQELKRGFEKQVKKRFPIGVQLTYSGDEGPKQEEDRAFLI